MAAACQHMIHGHAWTNIYTLLSLTHTHTQPYTSAHLPVYTHTLSTVCCQMHTGEVATVTGER